MGAAIVTDDTIEVDVDLVAETERAVLVRDADGVQVWLAKSLVTSVSGEVGSYGTIEIPSWLAEREGLA